MKYRILALDGGGSWAVLQVRALLDIYGNDDTITGHKVLGDFQLAAANSGGSIVLGELLNDAPLGQIRDFFLSQEKRDSIFVPPPRIALGDRLIKLIAQAGPQYNADKKLIGLRAALSAPNNAGARTLPQIAADLAAKNIHLHILITSFDYDRRRAVFFRSATVSSPSWGTGDTSTATLADAIHASSNAPVNYFDKPAEFPSDFPGRYWDGGIAGYNNPVAAGVVEAIGLGVQPTDIVALSIGTGLVQLPLARPNDPPSSPLVQQKDDPGTKVDLKKLATAIVDDPPDAASFVAHVLTGSGAGLNTPASNSRIVRMNPLVAPVVDLHGGGWIAPGGWTEDQFHQLANLNLDAVQQEDVDAINAYGDLWLTNLARNQAIRSNGATRKAEIGQDSYSVAKAAWFAIR